MTWFVVRFDDENTVEAVPNTWYIKRKSQCYWPPEGTTKSLIRDFIKKKQLPEVNWILYEASILGTYGNYNKAQQKANKARDTNYISSNNEGIKDKCKRYRNKNRKRYNKSDSEHELSSETEISSDDITYPEVLTEEMESSNRIRVENNIDESNQFKDTTNITSGTISTSNSTTVKTTLMHQRDSNFEPNTLEKRILRELHIISLKLEDISETVNVLLKDKADESQKLITYNKVPDVIQSFPVNHDSLAQLEKWLMTSEENKTILTKHLSRIGGCTVKEVVRRIMYHIFTNEVGMSYSWEGAKKKQVFKNLAVASIILSAVRLNKKTEDCTDSEIICFIKAWLVRSKDRFNNKNRDKNTAPETVGENTVEEN